MSSIFDILLDNFFIILIILFNIIASFMKKNEEEETSDLDELFSDFDVEDYTQGHSKDYSGSDQNIPSQFDYMEELDQQLTSMFDFIEGALVDQQKLIDGLRQELDHHSELGERIPELASLEVKLLTTADEVGDQLRHLKRKSAQISAMSEEADTEKLNILSQLQELLSISQKLNSEAHSLREFSSAMMNYIDDLALAQQITHYSLSPLVDHRHAEGVDLKLYPTPLPISMESMTTQMVRRSLPTWTWFPFKYEYLHSPASWPLACRDAARMLFSIAPSWRDEWRAWRGGAQLPLLPQASRRTLQWNIRESLNAWGDQLLGVYLMGLRFGPAAMGALLVEYEELFSPNSRELVTLGENRQRRGQQSVRAAAFFEVEVLLATLRSNGFRREADMYELQWKHFAGEDFFVTLRRGKVIPFPSKEIKKEIEFWVKSIEGETWRSWNHEMFSDVAGMVCTRGVWSLVKTHAQQLIEGELLSKLPASLHWLTLVHAAQKNPGHIATIRRFAERHQQRGNENQARTSQTEHDSFTQSDLISAIVLGDLFPLKRDHKRRA